mmetsp:Transcript_137710/g.243314  ORF Transcript_137710/g.243314 Transcript_137710/m.243314 type:complete len:450 (-) Transcript_137710:143-1492(-)
MESNRIRLEACNDYIVDINSSLRLCACGFPKEAHKRDSKKHRRTMTPTSLVKDADGDRVTVKQVIDDSNTNRVLRMINSYGVADKLDRQQGHSQACNDYIVDLRCNAGRCRCGFPKSEHKLKESSSPRRRRKEQGSVHLMAQSYANTRTSLAKGTLLQVHTSDEIKSLKSDSALASAFDKFESWTARILQEEQEQQKGECSPVSVTLPCLDGVAAGPPVAESLPEEKPGRLADKWAAQPEAQMPSQTLESKQSEQRDVVAARAAFHQARAKWTQAARDAEERAENEKLAAEERAAAARAKAVEAAAVARRREEAQAAKLREKEQRALEEELKKAKDEEAQKQVALGQERIRQREQNRLRKAREREVEALRQAEAMEAAERAKAAAVAAKRTVTISCAEGGQLNVTPDELQTLEKYVPDYTSKSTEELTELLPKLHMGAWLQGGTRLFAK